MFVSHCPCCIPHPEGQLKLEQILIIKPTRSHSQHILLLPYDIFTEHQMLLENKPYTVLALAALSLHKIHSEIELFLKNRRMFLKRLQSAYFEVESYTDDSHYSYFKYYFLKEGIIYRKTYISIMLSKFSTPNVLQY